MLPFSSPAAHDLGAMTIVPHGSEWTKKWTLPLASGQAQTVVSCDEQHDNFFVHDLSTSGPARDRALAGGVHQEGFSPGTIATRAALRDSTSLGFRPGAPAGRAEAAVCTGRAALSTMF